jgi:ABC-type antimicrobial peptide transport system permease subunit
MAELVAATPEVFETLGVRILRGRALDARDAAGPTGVAVIGERTAQAMFGRIDVVGETLQLQRRNWVGENQQPERTVTIVGVAASAGRELGKESWAVVYVPLVQQIEDRLVFAVRTESDPAEILGTARQTVQAVAPDAAMTQAITGRSLVAQEMLFFEIVAAIATMLGVMALVVALAGLYGILSFLVARRTREIGIRVAIGATDTAIRKQILREGLSPIVMGLTFGLGIGALFRFALQPMFRQLMPDASPIAILFVPVLFISAGMVACYLPGRRAARVNPVDALKQL